MLDIILEIENRIYWSFKRPIMRSEFKDQILDLKYKLKKFPSKPRARYEAQIFWKDLNFEIDFWIQHGFHEFGKLKRYEKEMYRYIDKIYR